MSDSAAIKGYSHQVMRVKYVQLRQLPSLYAKDLSADRGMVVGVVVGRAYKRGILQPLDPFDHQ